MKKGEIELMGETVTILIAVLVFVAFFFLFIQNAGMGARVYEQIYAKKIALGIDAAKPGMIINFNISEVYQFSENPVFSVGEVDGIGSVKVILSDGGGYTYYYFSDYKIEASIDKNDKNFFVVEVKDE